MNIGKQVECIHRITHFQAHASCNKLASICEKKCQELHAEDVLYITLDTVTDQFQGISKLIKTQLDQYCQKISYVYQVIVNAIKKRQEEKVGLLRKELFEQVMKKICFDKNLFSKIENRRYERLKCSELWLLMEESNTEQKIKKTALNKIYQKYQSQTMQFKQSFFTGKPIQNLNIVVEPKEIVAQKQVRKERVVQSLASIVKPVVNPCSYHEPAIKGLKAKLNEIRNQFEQGKKNYRELQSKYQQLKYHYKVLSTEKSNLEREFSKLRAIRGSVNGRRLSLKTWNIFQVITKKIKKQPKAIQFQSIRDEDQVLIQGNQSLQSIIPSNRSFISRELNEDSSKIVQMDNKNGQIIENQDDNDNEKKFDGQIVPQVQINQFQVNQIVSAVQETHDKNQIQVNQPIKENLAQTGKVMQTSNQADVMEVEDDDEEDFFTYLKNKKLF